MKTILRLLFLLIMFSSSVGAQSVSMDTCRVEKGKIIYTIDLRWTKQQVREIVKKFNLDSVMLINLFNGIPEVVSDSIEWKVKKMGPYFLELSKAMDDAGISNFNPNNVFLLEDIINKPPSIPNTEIANFGVNNFSKKNVFIYQHGVAHFYLPGHLNCTEVYLSGSFNNWSTLQLPMVKCDSGWVCSIKLLPGKYTYKYIADGSWLLDPNNINKEDDGDGNTNSFLFCCNYNFYLKGRTNARKVILSGSFNDWNERDLKLLKTTDGWELPVYLKDGTYGYKFIVDGEWITDPNNKDTRPDGKGNENSYLEIGEEYVFRLNGYANAHNVSVAGSFNNWVAGEFEMIKDSTGWELPFTLAPGNYEYKFIVDGQWIADPANRYTIGSGDFTNSVFSFKPNHVFVLNKFQEAGQVLVSGNFNNWDTQGFRMVKVDGRWEFPLYLKPGKCLYKFIVDGNWIVDPGNEIWEQNEHGTGNSVVWIEP